MKTVKLFQWIITLAIILVAVPGAAASVPQGPGDSARFQESSGGVESLHGSWAYFVAPSGYDGCFMGNLNQTLCFHAISETDDWDWVGFLWMRFPSDWTVNNVFVLPGTPSCDNGGTFGNFSWSTLGPNEVRIDHARYHANPSDRCQATYCFQVTSGSSTPGSSLASASWYWLGIGSGSPPYYPCSLDGYTPPQQPACDEAIYPPAEIPGCPRIHLPIVFRGH